MHKPAYIFDGRNLLDEDNLTRIGYNYVRIGKKYVEKNWFYLSWLFII